MPDFKLFFEYYMMRFLNYREHNKHFVTIALISEWSYGSTVLNRLKKIRYVAFERGQTFFCLHWISLLIDSRQAKNNCVRQIVRFLIKSYFVRQMSQTTTSFFCFCRSILVHTYTNLHRINSLVVCKKSIWAVFDTAEQQILALSQSLTLGFLNGVMVGNPRRDGVYACSMI